MNLSAIDVARYVINHEYKTDLGISNLKLQIILYMIQAYFMIKTKMPCFKEPIVKWEFSPIVEDVYMEYKSFGGGTIPEIQSYNVLKDPMDIWSVERIQYDDSIIPESAKTMINEVLDKFHEWGYVDMHSLVKRQTPFKSTEIHKEIELDSLVKFFS